MFNVVISLAHGFTFVTGGGLMGGGNIGGKGGNVILFKGCNISGGSMGTFTEYPLADITSLLEYDSSIGISTGCPVKNIQIDIKTLTISFSSI